MLIHVKVTPEAKHDSLVEKNKASLIISVKEPAEGNRANRRVLELVAEHFHISRSKIQIVTGHHSPGKILEIEV